MSNDMGKMLRIENVQIVDNCEDWKNAVQVAVSPLVKTGFVKPSYIDGIIGNVIKYGPYFVIAPDLALIHGRPEQGVLKKQLSVTVCRKGVVFDDKTDPVRVLVTLAATDANSHLDVMKILARMFADPSNIEHVASALDAKSIYDFFLEAGARFSD